MSGRGDIDLDRAFPEVDEEEENYPVPGSRRRKRHRILLTVLFLVAACAAILVFGCRANTVSVTGSTIYTDEEIAKLLTSEKYCKNTIYAYFYYNYRYGQEIPFIKSVKVKLSGLTSLSVTVTEYDIRGYVSYADSNLYFDETGRIIGNSDKIIEGVPSVSGFDFDVAEVGEMLPIEDLHLLDAILSITAEAKEFGITLTDITCADNGTITATCGSIQVKLGLPENIDEKMNLTAVLLKQVEGRSGILHMEDYDGTNGTRSFEEN